MQLTETRIRWWLAAEQSIFNVQVEIRPGTLQDEDQQVEYTDFSPFLSYSAQYLSSENCHLPLVSQGCWGATTDNFLPLVNPKSILFNPTLHLHLSFNTYTLISTNFSIHLIIFHYNPWTVPFLRPSQLTKTINRSEFYSHNNKQI
jgi:hypothetical protein